MTQRVAFITGGTKGIGLATAQMMIKSGHKVAVGSRTKPDDLDADLLWVKCDITDTESVDQAFTEVEEKLGDVEILVANAGMTKDMLLLRMQEEDFTQVIDANLTGAFRTSKRAIKKMMKAKWGRIIFLSSVVGNIGQAGQANYAASKAGLNGYAKTLAREFGSRNITVNLVAPGPIQTDMLEAAGEKAISAMVEAVPLGRVGEPREIAATIDFLASEGAGYITGTTIAVDGGLGMGG